LWSNVFTVALGATIPVALGVISFILQQRWTQRNNLRQLRQGRILDYLTNAYIALTAIEPAGGIGYLTIEEKQNVEAAFRDAYLYGDESVVAALNDFMEEFASIRDENEAGVSINPILEALRTQLRAILSLGKINQPDTPHITTGWRSDAALMNARGGALTGLSVEFMTSEEAMSLTGLPLSELFEYVRAGSLAQPVQLDGSLHWLASAVRSLDRSLKVKRSNEDRSASSNDAESISGQS
jgi:predicted DNA-binding transcriptional regulator AlpA